MITKSFQDGKMLVQTVLRTMVYSEVCLLYKTFGQVDRDFTVFLHCGFKSQMRADSALSP